VRFTKRLASPWTDVLDNQYSLSPGSSLNVYSERSDGDEE
jgi:hypothetical protein